MKTENRDNTFVEPFDDATAKKEEGLRVEMKSSIVFDQETSKPNLESQLGFHIMKEIAAFANTMGGYLYIGVNNSGDIVGIENDFTRLNEPISGLSFRYRRDWDSFQRIIMDVARRRLQPDIDRLISITKMISSSGKTVCRIYVKPCRDHSPVYYFPPLNKRFQGSESNLLFIRTTSSSVIEYRGEAKDKFIRDWSNHVNQLPPPETDLEDSLYFSVLEDGSFSLRERKKNNQRIIKRVYVSQSKGNFTGHILLVFNNGTLVFLNPNRLISEIKDNGGFSRYQVSNPETIVEAFYHDKPASLLVLMVWQRENEGFKMFDPDEFFKSEESSWAVIERQVQTFLPPEDMEVRSAFRIENGDELSKFWLLHPVLECSLNGIRPAVPNPHYARKEDTGTLLRIAAPGLYNDLLYLVDTGLARDGLLPPASKNLGYMRVKCVGHSKYEFVCSDSRPDKSSLMSADNEEAIEFCLAHYAHNFLHPACISYERPARADNRTNLVLVSGSGIPVVITATEFPNFSINGGTYSIQISMLQGVHLCKDNDWLVMCVRSTETLIYQIINIRDVPRVGMTLFDLEMEKLVSVIRPHNYTVLTSGILPSDYLAGEGTSIADWLSSDNPFLTPRCPLTGFSPSIWLQTRQAIRTAQVWTKCNGNFVSQPVDYSCEQKKRVDLLSQLDFIAEGGAKLFIPPSIREILPPEQLQEIQRECEALGIQIIDSELGMEHLKSLVVEDEDSVVS